jgi:hypothetical protein
MICIKCNMEVVRKEDYVGVKSGYLVLCKRCHNE